MIAAHTGQVVLAIGSIAKLVQDHVQQCVNGDRVHKNARTSNFVAFQVLVQKSKIENDYSQSSL